MPAMKSTVVISVVIRYHMRKIWQHIRRLFMMESDTLAGNATINQLQSLAWLNSKEQYIKESNTLAANVSIKQLQREIRVNTKGQYMKE